MGGRGGIFSLPRWFIGIFLIPLEIQVSSACCEIIGEDTAPGVAALGGYIGREVRGCCRAAETMGWFLQTLLLLLLVTPGPGAVITGVSADPPPTRDIYLFLLLCFPK